MNEVNEEEISVRMKKISFPLHKREWERKIY